MLYAFEVLALDGDETDGIGNPGCVFPIDRPGCSRREKAAAGAKSATAPAHYSRHG
jgi:hypothetical protein